MINKVLRTTKAMLAGANARARAAAIADSRSSVRTHFLAAMIDIGLLDELQSADMSRSDLINRLDIRRTDLFDAFLDTGLALGELRERRGRIALSGLRARHLVDDSFLRSHYLSFVAYQDPTYAELGVRLRGGPGRQDLDEHAQLIADVSHSAEHFVANHLNELTAERAPTRILEIGCGSGLYLRHLAEAAPTATGVAVELAADVAAVARANVNDWGLAHRFEVRTGDIRTVLGEDERFDLITLINNVYYFPTRSRAELFTQLAGHLETDGRLLVITMTVPGSVAASHFDLLLRSQEAEASLPNIDDLCDAMAPSFTIVMRERLIPIEPYWAVVGTASP